jgi:hypothetical protein
MPYPQYDPRDDITDAVMRQQGAGPLSFGLAGAGSGFGSAPMTGPTLPGLPQTPAGGVPGAGIAAAGPSVVQMPPQKMGMMGAMPGLGSLGEMPGMQGMGTRKRQRML